MHNPTIFFLSCQYDDFSTWENHLCSCFPEQTLTILPFAQYEIKRNFYQTERSKLFCITDNEYSLPFLYQENTAQLAMPVAAILPQQTSKKTWDFKQLSYLFEGIHALDRASIELVYARFHQLPLTILETKRLRLREWSKEDLPILQKLYQSFPNNPSIVCPWSSNENAQNWLDSYRHGAYDFFGYGLWCVEKLDTKENIGQCGIEYKETDSDRDGSHQLQYMILPDYQNQGYASEICFAICAYAREQLELDRLVTYIQRTNLSSRTLAQKLGFHFIDSVSIDDVLFDRSCLALSENIQYNKRR